MKDSSMARRAFALLLALCIIIPLMQLPVNAEQAAAGPDLTKAGSPDGMAGTSGGISTAMSSTGYGPNGKFIAPIEPPVPGSIPISTRAQLEAVRNNLSGSFHLTQDINLGGAEWIPINSFGGVFDGQGFVLRNMRITGVYAAAGLFGSANGASILNLGLEDTYIDITMPGGGVPRVGGIVGQTMTRCSIANSYNTGSISYSSADAVTSIMVGGIAGSFGGIYSSLENCYNTSSIYVSSLSTFSVFAGGIAGVSSMVGIDNCFNTGSIIAAASNDAVAGGIAGLLLSDDYIANSYNTGSISATSISPLAGGIAGYAGNPLIIISNCYNTGNISTNHDGSNPPDASSGVGGIIGRSSGALNTTTTNYCYWNSDSLQTVNGEPQTPKRGIGILGSSVDTSIPLTSAQMRNRNSYTGWDFAGLWAINAAYNDGYPFFKGISFNEAGASVTGQVRSYNPNNPTEITMTRDSDGLQYTATIAATPGSGQITQGFTITSVEDGTYTMLVTKAVHTMFIIRNITVSEDVVLSQHSRNEIQNITLLCGDINSDGEIGPADLNILRSSNNYMRRTVEAMNSAADLNGDGEIGPADLNILRSSINYMRGTVVEYFD